ncbi:MAG: SDR family oxidoreductase [Thainema sp.]
MKTVLITGCSSGFGRGMVDEFLRRGWSVIATMREAEARSHIFADLLNQYDQQLVVLSLDVTDAAECQAVGEFVRTHGRLDCLVNNAGNCYLGAFEDLSDDQLRQQFETNFFGTATLTRSLLPYLRDSRGSVIFLSSTFGVLGFPLTSAYCASKFAIEGLAESLYYELQPHSVRIAILEPGASRTNFGKNAVWAESAVDAYSRQTQNFHRFKEKLSATATDNTARVAAVTADLAEGQRSGLRIRIGQDAIATHWLQSLLPAAIRHRLLNRFFHRTFWQTR